MPPACRRILPGIFAGAHPDHFDLAQQGQVERQGQGRAADKTDDQIATTAGQAANCRQRQRAAHRIEDHIDVPQRDIGCRPVDAQAMARTGGACRQRCLRAAFELAVAIAIGAGLRR